MSKGGGAVTVSTEKSQDPATWGIPDEAPLTIVSTDGHACPVAEDYGPYLDPKYREFMPQYLSDMETHQLANRLVGYPFSPAVLDVIDERHAIRTGGESGYFDPERRIRESEAEGVVAEFLHPFGHHSATPFFDFQNSPCSPELRAAGARAHNRFLEDFCSEAPGRLFGVPCIYPWPDWDSAIEDCRRVREVGFRAIVPPQQVGWDMPAFYDPWWDPLWAACQDLGLVVHIHAGIGYPQGSLLQVVQSFSEGPVTVSSEFDPDSDAEQESPLAQGFESVVERRPLWQLMWGGAFDRFPRLKVAFVEVHGDWVPLTLAYLDGRHAKGGTPLRLKPTEYWRRHCAVGASLMRYGDVEARHAIGVDRMMFGTDFPHMEGTWPNTHQWIHTTLSRIPRAEARQILGENAIEFYDLDRELLDKAARRVGPYPEDLFGEGFPEDRRVVNHFSYRAGINKQPSFDEAVLAEMVDEDEKGALSFASR
jgi:predicted TIM-barrel fold metal-dependent hydrolase